MVASSEASQALVEFQEPVVRRAGSDLQVCPIFDGLRASPGVPLRASGASWVLGGRLGACSTWWSKKGAARFFQTRVRF